MTYCEMSILTLRNSAEPDKTCDLGSAGHPAFPLFDIMKTVAVTSKFNMSVVAEFCHVKRCKDVQNPAFISTNPPSNSLSEPSEVVWSKSALR